MKVLLSLVLGAGTALSANGQLQSPVQTYFVPLPEDSLFESFKRIASTASGDIETTISIAVAANKTIIYYDHHEDGYDFTFLGDVSTRQSSTQIWGDNNPSNGIPPGYTEDVLMGGSTILLKNQVPVGGTRGETILYDGRDRILATLPIAVTRSAFPGSPGGLLAGAVEVFNRDSWGQEYVAPVGNSTDHPSDTDPFTYSSFYIMAGFDNTEVTLPDQTTRVIDIGQSIVIPIQEGDVITSDRPIQVDLVAGEAGSDFELRWYAQVDRSKWSNMYLSPVAESLAHTAFWFYNPKDVPITVSFDGANIVSGSVTIPAQKSKLVVASGVAGPAGLDTILINAGDEVGRTKYSGVRFVSDDDFYGLVAVDNGGDGATGRKYDWGFPLIPTSELTSQALVGLGSGCVDSDCGGPDQSERSVVWVTPVENTIIFVDYNGDGTFDATFDVEALGSLRLTDPNSKNMTGAIIASIDKVNPANGQPDLTGTPVKIAVVWGQDPRLSGSRDKQGLDLGTAIVPLANPFVSKQVVGVVNPDGTMDTRLLVDQAGDIIQYEITVSNVGFASLTDIKVEDKLIGDTLTGPVESFPPGNGVLQRGETFVYKGNYTVKQDDIDGFGYVQANIIENSAIVSAKTVPPIVVNVTTPIALANITGTVYEDINGDDEGEVELEGVSIKLYNATTDELLSATVTNAAGFYEFLGLPAGNYTVTQTNLNSTFTDVKDANTGIPNDDPNSITLVAVGGPAYNDNDFIDERLGAINGIVTDDADVPIAGVNITLINVATNATITTFTDATGNYAFLNQRPGNYTLVEVNLAAYPSDVSDQDNQPDGDAGDTDTTVDNQIDVTLNPTEVDAGNDFKDYFGSANPSATPSAGPTGLFSGAPSATPSGKPSITDSSMPSSSPSNIDSSTPSSIPSDLPSLIPSSGPSAKPSAMPSNAPSNVRSGMPSPAPSSRPSKIFSDSPSLRPSVSPSVGPSSAPSEIPSASPSVSPSNAPSNVRSGMPSPAPSSRPSKIFSDSPSATPSTTPSGVPSVGPSLFPSAGPTMPTPPDNCCRDEDLVCEVCAAFRSPDFCALNESFASLVSQRTSQFRNNPQSLVDEGYWFHYLEDKIAAYLLSVKEGMPVPEVFCCTTNVADLDKDCLTGGIPESTKNIVIKATNFHSSQGVFVLTNFTAEAVSNPNANYMMDLMNGMATSYNDVISELTVRQATKIIVEEFIGDTLPTEYKFHVVNGSIASIDIIGGRGGDCPCYAVVDADGKTRLDNDGCFEPGGIEIITEDVCAPIDLTLGKKKCGPVKKDLYLCDEAPEVDECLLSEMKAAALKMGSRIGVYMRIDMFVIGNKFYVQEYSANHMNGLRHCAAKKTGDCVDSCFMGRMWDAAGGPYGGGTTAVPDGLDGFTDLSPEEQCALINGVTKPVYVSTCDAYIGSAAP